MYHAETAKSKLILFLSILWPIMVTQVGLFAMNLVDTIMAGRVGTNDLAGVAIGSSLWMPIFTGIGGILLALTPIVAQLMGRNQREKIFHTVTQSLYLSVILALLVVFIGSLALDPLLTLMDLDPAVHYIAFHYLVGLSIGIVPLFLASVLRNFFDGQGKTRITMVITVLAVPFNVLLNYGFIFGNFGLPALGGVGAGYATAITYWLILFISIWMTFKIKSVRYYRVFAAWARPSWKTWKEQLAIGIPMGLSIFFEASIFSVVTLLIGMMFSTTTIAANQIVLNFSALIFMIPLSVAMALTIVVGYSVGGDRLKAAKQYSFAGVLSGLSFIAVCAVFLYFLREPIAYLYTSDPEVVAIAAQFFIIAIFYQLSDVAQVGLQGVLRGYQDVQVPFLIALVSYWIVGIPSGYMLAAFTFLGPFGLWIGITAGLTCAAAGFFIRLRFVQNKFAALTEKESSRTKSHPIME